MWQSGTAPPRRDIWVLGGGVTDGLTEAQQPVPARMLAPGPRESWAWHRSLALAPTPTVGNRPGGVLECQILGFRRGAGSALSRKSLSARCRGGKLAGYSLLGVALCPRAQGGRGGLGSAPRAKAQPSSPGSPPRWVGEISHKSNFEQPRGGPLDGLLGQRANAGWLSNPVGDRTQLSEQRDPRGYRVLPPLRKVLLTPLWASGLSAQGIVCGMECL